MILDTHVWLWYLEANENLRQSIKSAILEGSQDCLVSSISVWEVLLLHEKGRYSLGPNPVQRVREMLTAPGISVADLTAEIAILSRSLPFNHDDPADRFIAATAKAYGLPLATDDVNLRSLKWLKTI
ncbi:MAG TPA: type II toxin-antitoxin system VapC family toxin [Fimbriimonadaceae bacterium]|nr:type II toxin-antitoxin system VapC family toxin [Fimbriimonadaceae bacterium]